MGALLAMRLAVELPREVAGVALLSPAVALGGRVPRWLRRPLAVLGLLDARFALAHAGVSRIVLTKGLSDIADAAVRADHPGYRQVPLRALLNLVALQRMAAVDLAKVTQPALVIHAAHDHTCPVDAARALYARLGASDKRLVILEESFHVVTVDRESARVRDEVAAFVDRVAHGLVVAPLRSTRAHRVAGAAVRASRAAACGGRAARTLSAASIRPVPVDQAPPRLTSARRS